MPLTCLQVAMAGSEEDLAAEIIRQGPCWLLAESVAMAPRDSLKRFSLRDLAEEMEAIQCMAVSNV